MNISTGGPHILLFERDQQLTGLLISEFQLAGYECHTARTAVEVFDAIARQPIRLVLVNLAQAAAARREFWVALDTQRRGRGVQVMTFHCSNIANYGPKDPDEHATTMVDLEVDGMMGIMNLVDGVRARVPVGTTSATLNQAQRISRSTGQTNLAANANTHFASGPSVPRSPLPNENRPAPVGSSYASQGSSLEPGFIRGGETQARMQSTGQTTNTAGNISSQSSYMSGSNTGTPPQQGTYSQNASLGNIPNQQPSYTQNVSTNTMSFQQPSYTQNTNATNNPPAQLSPYAQNMSNNSNSPAQPSSYVQNTSTSNNAPPQPSYTEKIRAVLYPNQRAWSPQGAATQTPSPERASYDSQMTAPPPQPAPTANDSMGPTGSTALQRLANGQMGSEAPWESGLAQLSRMVQERNTFLENTNNTPAYPSPILPQERNNAFLESAVNNTPLYPASPTRINAFENTSNTPAYPAPTAPQARTNPFENTSNTPAYPSPTAPQARANPFENTGNTPAYPSPTVGMTQDLSSPPTMDKTFGQFSPTLSPTAYTAPGAAPTNPSTENLSTRTLRASPIQDLPGERNTGSLSSSESGKRPDVLSRTNYAQQPATSHPSLASLSAATQPQREKESIQERMAGSENQTGIPSINIVQEGATYSTRGRTTPEKAPIKPGNEMGKPIKTRITTEQPTQIQAKVSSETALPAQGKSLPERAQASMQERTSVTESGMPAGTRGALPTQLEERMQEQEAPMQTSLEIDDYSDYKEVENNKRLLEIEKAQAEIKVALGQHVSFDTSNTPSNALLLDIMQSLPPMPAPIQQQIQSQALNGRATRSLGSVLLEGHLVPQSRLEVAQNVQRMLRGVDLNYQLGEILLMFKLLTPDQLLAASLVSYGMITTTQISALGRIRQELHAIGLEYDLENLLIMFRILTPEQLREVRASWQ